MWGHKEPSMRRCLTARIPVPGPSWCWFGGDWTFQWSVTRKVLPGREPGRPTRKVIPDRKLSGLGNKVIRGEDRMESGQSWSYVSKALGEISESQCPVSLFWERLSVLTLSHLTFPFTWEASKRPRVQSLNDPIPSLDAAVHSPTPGPCLMPPQVLLAHPQVFATPCNAWAARQRHSGTPFTFSRRQVFSKSTPCYLSQAPARDQ